MIGIFLFFIFEGEIKIIRMLIPGMFVKRKIIWATHRKTIGSLGGASVEGASVEGGKWGDPRWVEPGWREAPSVEPQRAWVEGGSLGGGSVEARWRLGGAWVEGASVEGGSVEGG